MYSDHQERSRAGQRFVLTYLISPEMNLFLKPFPTMKRSILCLAIAAFGTLSIKAQDGERLFKRFKGDVSLGYVRPLDSRFNGGLLFAMEPKIAVIDQLALGLRIEAAVMARFTGNDIYGNREVDEARAAGSYVATADYYFTNNYSFRPFIGAGAGAFATAQDGSNYDDAVTDLKFGGIIRVGGEVKHFRFGVELNLVPGTSGYIYDYNTGTQVLRDVKNSYIGIKAGVCFGGGPLNR
jgi:outer membrane protein X